MTSVFLKQLRKRLFTIVKRIFYEKISKVLMVAAPSTAALSANADHAAASSNGGLFAGWKAMQVLALATV